MKQTDRIRLTVIGLSVGQIRQGAYALILGETDGPIRIPIIIGEAEARSIAARMDHVTTPRPLTHDLFATMAHAFGIALQEVFIYKFDDGVFLSELTFTDGERRVTIDSRTSDAIAIAMRTGSPIYTTREIMDECGFVLQTEPPTGEATEPEYSPAELRRLLEKAISEENYEEAARIKDLLNEFDTPQTDD